MKFGNNSIQENTIQEDKPINIQKQIYTEIRNMMNDAARRHRNINSQK